MTLLSFRLPEERIPTAPGLAVPHMEVRPNPVEFSRAGILLKILDCRLRPGLLQLVVSPDGRFFSLLLAILHSSALAVQNFRPRLTGHGN